MILSIFFLNLLVVVGYVLADCTPECVDAITECISGYCAVAEVPEVDKLTPSDWEIGCKEAHCKSCCQGYDYSGGPSKRDDDIQIHSLFKGETYDMSARELAFYGYLKGYNNTDLDFADLDLNVDARSQAERICEGSAQKLQGLARHCGRNNFVSNGLSSLNIILRTICPRAYDNLRPVPTCRR